MAFGQHRNTAGLLGLAVLFCATAAGEAEVRPPAGKPPVCRHGLVLKYRRAGEDGFKPARKYSLECYQDAEGNGIYISQAGGLAVVPHGLFQVAEGREKAPLSQHGLELAVRKADDREAKFGVECYLDDNTGTLIYLCESGSIAVVPARYAVPTRGRPKRCVPIHALSLKVRQPGGEDSRAVKKFAVAVFQDQNNDNLLYLSETGALAVVPRALVNRDAATGSSPRWLYAVELAVRRAGQRAFKDAKRCAVEAYRDENNGCLVLVTDQGALAVVPPKQVRLAEGKRSEPQRKQGLVLAVRTPAEKEFTAKTQRFGVEAHAERNSGQTVYVSETGSLAVAPASEE